MDNTVRLINDGALATIQINRADHGNRITLSMTAELERLLRTIPENVKVVLLRSSGDDFSLGRDSAEDPKSKLAVDLRSGLTNPILRLYDAFSQVPVPIIGAIQGRAFGLGCAIAASCDLTIVADTARFKLPEMERDLPPTLAMSALMPKVSTKAVAWLVYAMAEIDGGTACQLGIASEVVPEDELAKRTEVLTRSLLTRSRLALSTVKEYLRSAPSMPAAGASDYASALLAAVLSSGKT